MKAYGSLSLKCFIFLFMCSLAFSGCASFPNKEFPKYSFDQFKPLEVKPAIDYDLKYFWTNRENAAALPVFCKKVEDVFAKSNLFSEYKAGTGSSDYHFSIIMKNEGDIASAQLSGFISGLTLTLIPAQARDNFVLTVDVKKGDEVIKHYQYEHYMDTWIQLFLVFMTEAHHPNKVVNQVWDDMLLAFLHDFEQEYILVAQSEEESGEGSN